MLRGGAKMPAPTTPSTIALITRYWLAARVLARRFRCARNITPAGRPPAPAARPPAGQAAAPPPAAAGRRIDRPVPSSQRARLIRPPSTRHPGAGAPVCGACLASIASRAIPGCRGSTHRPPPRFSNTVSTMSAHDHRTPGCPRFPGAIGAVAALLMAMQPCPALAGAQPVCFPRSPAPISPRLRRALGVHDTDRERARLRAHLRRRAPRAGHARDPRAAGSDERVGATFFLVGEQLQRNPGLGREIVAAGHEIALHCHRHRNLLRLAPWQVREDIARAQGSDRGSPRDTRRSCIAPPTGYSTPPRWRSRAAAAGAP